MKCDKIEVASVCHRYDFSRHRCIEEIPVFQLPGSSDYFFVSKMAIDVDGAPRAYHPRDSRPPDNHTEALDWLTSVSSQDLHGIQGQNGIGPRPGFYVSGTSLENPAYPENDTRRYVDGETIPYIVLVNPFPQPRGDRIELGDCGMVIDLQSGRSSVGIFADVGHAVGEDSLRLALNLGLDPTASDHPPKVSGYEERVDFLHIIFSNSKVLPPWHVNDIENMAREKFTRWGGIAQVRSCFPHIPLPI